MLEKRFYAVPPQAFTADGTSNGVITVASAAAQFFKVKMKVFINAASLPTLALEVKEIDSETNIQVGPIPGPGVPASISSRTDISAYTVALGATISADEQRRPSIDYAEIMRAVYDEEPTVALRNVLVDEVGNRITSANPLPVIASYERFFTLITGSSWLNLGSYDEVVPSVTGNDLLFSFIEDGAVIGEALVTNYLSELGWSLALSSFINDDDGTKLQDDDGTFLNLD